MKKFFYSIAQSLSLFSNETLNHHQNETKVSENDSIIKNKSTDDNVQEKLNNIVSSGNLENNRVIDKNNLNLYKSIYEHLKRGRIDNDDNANTTAAILALLREIQVQLQSITNGNFITYEEQYTEILFSNLTSEILESFFSKESLINESKKTPLGVVCQIKGKHQTISTTEKDVDQHETSAKGERHSQDEVNGISIRKLKCLC